MSLLEPPSYPINEVKLGRGQEIEGNIVNVSLYANRADISRAYRFRLGSGQNQAVIYGLPNVLDKRSIRVEGRGKATIQDVTVSLEAVPEAPKTSATLEALAEEKEVIKLSLARYSKTLAGLDRYLESRTGTNPKSEAPGFTVLPLVEDYNAAAEKYDLKAMELRRELKHVEAKIEEEKAALVNSVTANKQSLMKASVGVFAEAETEIELLLKYAVTSASWNAMYDIRANTDAKESPVEIVYKAAIVQSTAEAPKKRKGLSLGRAGFRTSSISRSDAAEALEESDDDMGFGLFDGGPPLSPIEHVTAAVTSRGNVNATFRVPGLVSIPSDGIAHNVTIASLKPEAKLSWLAVPSVDARAHLTTRITNTSEYTLLAGSSSVYVDGSFISKSSVPHSSPQESFTCALGLDPSVRITYPSQIKKSSTSGLLNKISSTSYTQRISVHNSKTTAIDNLRILGRIPVSQDTQITVKLISPSLPPAVPAASSSSGTSHGTSSNKDFAAKVAGAKTQVKVAEGVVAQWYGGAEEGDGAAEHLGKDGKVQWVCALGAQAKVDLTLQWEVSAAEGVVVLGL